MFTPRADVWLLRAETAVDRVRLAAALLVSGEGRLCATLAVGLTLSLWWPDSPPSVPERVVHLPGSGWVDADDVEGLAPGVPDGERLVVVPESRLAAAITEAPAAPSLSASDGSGLAAMAFGRPLSINRATAGELESLPGIGPALAARIVAGRPYTTVEDLDRVRGIGPATLARLRSRVVP